MLTRVTLTGADDLTDPLDLADLTDAFPFVEWGILFSGSKVGTRRYPSDAWLAKLKARTERFSLNMGLAAHFCGQFTRDTVAGDDQWLRHIGPIFQRVQLNGFKAEHANNVVALSKIHPFEFILQTRTEEDLPASAQAAAAFERGKGSVLYDPSGGQGIPITIWPATPEGLHLGFAGGINPDNVEDVLKAIGDRPEPFWIDMESGVRTKDNFDLEKCHRVLTACAPHVVTYR